MTTIPARERRPAHRTRRIHLARTMLDAAEWEMLGAAAARLGRPRSVVLRLAFAAGLPLLDDVAAGQPGMPEWETAVHLFPLSTPEPLC